MKNHYNAAIIFYLIQMVLLISVINGYFMDRYNIFESGAGRDVLELFLGPVILILNVAGIFVIKNLYEKGVEKQRYQINTLKFKHMEEQNRLYRQHRHDLENHLSVLSGLVQEGKYAELADYLSRYRKAVYSSMIEVDTGMEELDILLYSKIASARQRKIQVDFKCSAAVNCNKKYALDMISIMGNMLDNAIEACEEIQEEKREISVEIKEDSVDYIFRVVNSYNPAKSLPSEDLFKEGFSTKEGGDRGHGLYIIKRLADRYEGEIETVLSESLFDIKVEIPRFRLEG